MSSLDQAVDLLHLFGDATRVRLLSLLSGRELTVAEITSVTQLPQSRVSTHLGKLRETGLLRDRRAGPSTFYAMNDGAMPEQARKVWALLHDQIDDAVLGSDRKRAEAVVAARDKSAAWPDRVAGEMERHYSPGRTWEAMARGFVGLMKLGDVLDVGAGDGTIAELIAPRARSYTCLDVSERMVDAARVRLRGAKNVRFAVGDAEALPFDDASFDQVILFHVLTHTPKPVRALEEAARVLRAHGTLAVITLDAHEHGAVTAAYHHVNQGSRASALRKSLERAGLEVDTCEVTSRERRAPHFQIVTAFANKKTNGKKP